MMPLCPSEPITLSFPFPADRNSLLPSAGTTIPAMSCSPSSASDGVGTPLQLLLSNPIKFVKSTTTSAGTPVEAASKSKLLIQANEQKERLKNAGAAGLKKGGAASAEKKTKLGENAEVKNTMRKLPYNMSLEPFPKNKPKRKLDDTEGRMESPSKKARKNAVDGSSESTSATKKIEGIQGTDESHLHSSPGKNLYPNLNEKKLNKGGIMVEEIHIRNSGKQTLYPFRSRGIHNRSVYCYRIAALQFLSSSPHIRAALGAHELIVEQRGQCVVGKLCIACTLRRIQRDLFHQSPLSSKTPYISSRNPIGDYTADLHRIRQELGPDFSRLGTQEDSADYVNALIHQEMYQSRKSGTTGIMSPHTYLEHKSVIVCSFCNHKSSSPQPGDNITLSSGKLSKSQRMSLSRLISDFFKSDQVELKCEKCGREGTWKDGTQFTRDKIITTLPDFLILRLLRFSGVHMLNGRIRMDKLMNGIDFPQTFRITRPYGEVAIYELQAIISHQGEGLGDGHYVAYIRQPDGIWTLCDDETVRVRSWEEVLSQDGGRYQAAMFGYTKLDPPEEEKGDAWASRTAKTSKM